MATRKAKKPVKVYPTEQELYARECRKNVTPKEVEACLWLAPHRFPEEYARMNLRINFEILQALRKG